MSTQVFFSLVLKALEDAHVSFNVKEVISDFEINIHKAIDDSLENVSILGCFFHFAKALRVKVDKRHMRNKYQNNEKFQEFVKLATALSTLPADKLCDGYNFLKDNFDFEDEKTQAFKVEFLKYIKEYWIEGVYPPQVWLNFQRSHDLTNNNQV